MQANGLREHFENQSDGRTRKNELSLRDVRRMDEQHPCSRHALRIVT